MLIAGPCSAESREQVLEAASMVKAAGADLFRAGVWKPRTHPGCFEGVGEEALEWLVEARRQTGLDVVTEVAKAGHVELCLDAGVRNMWLGARTTINPFLVQEIADALKGSDARILLKNPVAPDTGLWVGAVDRMRSAGMKDIVLVHRGFVSREKGRYRNDPMWQVLLEIRHELPGIPIICDPSHIAGDSALVPEVAQMAMDLGLDGLMIECHPDPGKALSDAAQQLSAAQLSDLLGSLVIRSADSPDEKFKADLSALRAQIDLLDASLVDALARRMDISRHIGQLKKENRISILQAERWDVVMEDVLSRAAESGLDSRLVEEVFALIHAYSVKQQQ